MTYSIIGSGNIGAALARQFSRAGVNVTIANRRGADTLAPLVQELGGAISARTIKDAVQADTIFLALPFSAVETFGGAKDQWRGKIVIDATNAYDVRPEFLAGRLSSDIVAAALPGAAVGEGVQPFARRGSGARPIAEWRAARRFHLQQRRRRGG